MLSNASQSMSVKASLQLWCWWLPTFHAYILIALLQWNEAPFRCNLTITGVEVESELLYSLLMSSFLSLLFTTLSLSSFAAKLGLPVNFGPTRRAGSYIMLVPFLPARAARERNKISILSQALNSQSSEANN